MHINVNGERTIGDYYAKRMFSPMVRRGRHVGIDEKDGVISIIMLGKNYNPAILQFYRNEPKKKKLSGTMKLDLHKGTGDHITLKYLASGKAEDIYDAITAIMAEDETECPEIHDLQGFTRLIRGQQLTYANMRMAAKNRIFNSDWDFSKQAKRNRNNWVVDVSVTVEDEKDDFVDSICMLVVTLGKGVEVRYNSYRVFANNINVDAMDMYDNFRDVVKDLGLSGSRRAVCELLSTLDSITEPAKIHPGQDDDEMFEPYYY